MCTLCSGSRMQVRFFFSTCGLELIFDYIFYFLFDVMNNNCFHAVMTYNIDLSND